MVTAVSDNLDISSGILIDTAHIRELAVRLDQATETVLGARRMLSRLAGEAWAPVWAAPVEDPTLVAIVREASALLAATADRLAGIVGELTRAITAYEVLEWSLATGDELRASALGRALGTVIPPLVLGAIPLALSSATAVLATAPVSVPLLLFGALRVQREGGAQELLRRSGLLADARTVAVLRPLVSGVDDALMARSGLSGGLSTALGDAGLRVSSTESLARGAAAIGGTPSTAVTVRTGERTVVQPPSGIADLAERIPNERDEQIVIERYPRSQGDRWIVFIDGTRSPSIGGDEEPWDMASNLAGVAGAPSAAETSVIEAMRLAGIGAEDPVLMVGYSQGGLVAARLAHAQSDRVAGLVTLGSPIGSLPVPRDIPVLMLEHVEDPVPALGGVIGAGAASSLATVTVRRALYSDGAPRGESLVPAHQLARYRETAALVDAGADERLAPMRDLLATFEGGGSAQGYRADRISDDGTAKR